MKNISAKLRITANACVPEPQMVERELQGILGQTGVLKQREMQRAMEDLDARAKHSVEQRTAYAESAFHRCRAQTEAEHEKLSEEFTRVKQPHRRSGLPKERWRLNLLLLSLDAHFGSVRSSHHEGKPASKASVVSHGASQISTESQNVVREQ